MPDTKKGLIAPKPWSKVMVTGEVSPDKDNLQSWFKVGAWCVGMGSKLFPKEILTTQDWAYITNKCKECLKAIQ